MRNLSDMRNVKEQTEKIIYTGSNHDMIHQHFKKWESDWGFETKLFTYNHNSYEETMKGNVKADLIIRGYDNHPPKTIPFGRFLSFIKLDDGKIVINIEIP